MAPRPALMSNMMITWFGYQTSEPELPARYPDFIKYLTGQLEQCPETQRLHWQLYVEVDPQQRLSALQRVFPTCHVERRGGTQAEAIAYVTKEETRVRPPVVYGTPRVSHQGQRTDLEDAIELLKAGGLKRVARDAPAAFVKYAGGLEKLEEALRDKPTDPDFEPRPWQGDILRLVEGPANDRTIIWVYDEEGNKGKSRLTRHLVFEHEAVLLTGKLADMAYTYNSEPIVIFDVPRTAVEHMKHLFTFAEMLKNGMVHSTKYVPRVKYFKPPHVIFFANIPAPEGTWSADRLMTLTL